MHPSNVKSIDSMENSTEGAPGLCVLKTFALTFINYQPNCADDPPDAFVIEDVNGTFIFDKNYQIDFPFLFNLLIPYMISFDQSSFTLGRIPSMKRFVGFS
jgi:hypothetical protein